MSRLCRSCASAVILGCCFVGIVGGSIARAGSEQPNQRELQLQTVPEGTVNSVAASPDGSLIATASDVGGIRLYDASTGKMLRAIGGGDRCAVFSPDGRLVAAAGFHMDKLMKLYDVQSGNLVLSLHGKTIVETFACAFSPDGKLFAAAGREDQQVLVWDLPSGELRHRLADQNFSPTAIAFSPDSATLVSGGGDRLVRLWDMKSGQIRQMLKGHHDWICTVAFSADGQTIASGSCDFGYHRGRDPSNFEGGDPGCDSEWRWWDAKTGQLKRTVTEPGRLLSLALAPDGKSLACGLGNEVRLYDLSTESPGRTVARHAGLVTGVSFSRDADALLSSSHDHTVQRVTLSDGQVKWQLSGQYEQVNSVALSQDGALLVTGSSDGRFALRRLKGGNEALASGAVRLWDARTGRLVRRLGDPSEQVMAVALSPDAHQVVSGGANQKGAGLVRVWDASTGAPGWSATDHTAEVLAVAVAPDGLSLATASADGAVKIRDVKSGTVLHTLDGHAGGATSVAFTPDGALLVCGEGNGGARVWQTKTGKLLQTGSDSRSRAASINVDRMLNTVVMRPDGKTFYARNASMGNTYSDPLKLWEIGAGEALRELTAPKIGGRPIALSPDGTIIAGGGKSVQLSDTRTGKPLRNLQGILKKVQALAFSADGRLIVSGGSYDTTNIWDVASGRLLVTLFTFCDNETGRITDDWLAYNPAGYYDGSPGVERYLAWRVGDELQTAATLGKQLHAPERIEAALTGEVQKTASQ